MFQSAAITALACEWRSEWNVGGACTITPGELTAAERSGGMLERDHRGLAARGIVATIQPEAGSPPPNRAPGWRRCRMSAVACSRSFMARPARDVVADRHAEHRIATTSGNWRYAARCA